MSDSFDRDGWERRWAGVLRDHPGHVAGRAPSPTMIELVGDLPPGRALDAGAGHGAETLWLAARGWQVTAVDFSASALRAGQTSAELIGPDVADRVDWIEADLGAWTPPQAAFDLVLSLYVHVSGSVGEMVNRLGSGVGPGGTLLLVGHQPIDPDTGAPTPAAGQVQVSVDDARAALDPQRWAITIAENRRRAAVGSGVDAVICATAYADS